MKTIEFTIDENLTLGEGVGISKERSNQIDDLINDVVNGLPDNEMISALDLLKIAYEKVNPQTEGELYLLGLAIGGIVGSLKIARNEYE